MTISVLQNIISFSVQNNFSRALVRSQIDRCNCTLSNYSSSFYRILGVGWGEDSQMLTYFLEGGLKMLTVAEMGEGGVNNEQKSADALYGRSLWSSISRAQFYLLHPI